MAFIPASDSVIAFQSRPSSLLVGASIIGLTPVNVVNMPSSSVIAYQLAGSVLAVSGNFTSGNTSVTAFQGGAWTVSVVGNMNSSVTTYPGGTPITSVVNTVPSSMMVGASIFGTVPVTQTTSPWIVNVPTPSYIAYQLAGSVLAVSGSFSGGNSSVQLLGGNAVIGSVTALQGTNPWVVSSGNASIITVVQGSVAVAGNLTANISSASVVQQGTWRVSVLGVGTDGEVKITGSVQGVMSVLGTVPVTQATTPWIVGSVLLGSSNASIITVGGSTGNSSVQLLSGQNHIGSVTAIQGTNPWQVNVPTSSYISYQLAGSILAVSGSFSGGNSSVQLLPSNAVIGSVTALQGTNPWQVNVPTPSYISYQLAGSIMAVSGSFSSGNTSVTAFQGGNWTVSVVNTVPSSMMVGASIFGTVPVTQATSPWVVNMPSPSIIILTPAGSVQAVRTDNASVIAILTNSSVAVLQGTNPWVVNVPTPSYLSIQPGGSVMNVNVSGSIAAFVGNNIGSIVGTYAEDTPHTSGDKGIFSLHVRNDTMSSITSTDGDYSPFAVGPVGELITGNSPITKWVSGIGSIMYGGSVQLLAPPGASIFTYITGINVINESANVSRVTITQGLGGAPSFSPSSILTWAISPATGGSNAIFPNPLRVLANNGVSASISGVSSVLITITGFTSKT